MSFRLADWRMVRDFLREFLEAVGDGDGPRDYPKESLCMWTENPLERRWNPAYLMRWLIREFMRWRRFGKLASPLGKGDNTTIEAMRRAAKEISRHLSGDRSYTWLELHLFAITKCLADLCEWRKKKEIDPARARALYSCLPYRKLIRTVADALQINQAAAERAVRIRAEEIERIYRIRRAHDDLDLSWLLLITRSLHDFMRCIRRHAAGGPRRR